VANHPTCTWTGASGNKYVYEIYARHAKLPSNEPGNFIYARLDEHHRWIPVFIGHGDLAQQAEAEPRIVKCIDAKGATHVHLHPNYSQDKRLAEKIDPLENFPQAYLPDGCNENEGR
jgi:hypothetical protein